MEVPETVNRFDAWEQVWVHIGKSRCGRMKRGKDKSARFNYFTEGVEKKIGFDGD